LLSFDAIWSKPEDDERNIDWVRRLWSTMRKYSNGRTYLNFMATSDGDTGMMRDSLGAATYDRLVKIKTGYDPTNFFRLNQNIEPG
jgi:Berberine and berberine like